MDRTLNPGEAGQQAPPLPQLEGLAALLPRTGIPAASAPTGPPTT